MTPTEADELAKRIINTWHGGPPLKDWIETLDTLDAGTAGTAYIRLRAETEHAPTIARYVAVYRGLATVHNQPTPDTPSCVLCDGTRYVECVDDRRHAGWCKHRGTKPNDPGDCQCHAVDPCRCQTGRN